MRPADLFDRETEWSDLETFVASPSRGLRVGIVYGRRRLGKSFLLRRLAREHDGIYHMALEEEPEPALRRFADTLAARRDLGQGLLRFRDWVDALRTALSGPEPLLIIDELPYLLAHPDGAVFTSALQALVDESRDDPEAPRKRVILCGSALSVMAGLLSGTKALRGRVELDMLLRTFDYRTTAEYYGIQDPAVAFRLYAVFGGVPGYRDLTGEASPQTPEELDALILRTVGNPSHALFSEPSYLLREDPRVRDRSLYFSILEAVSRGARTPSAIAAAIGRDARSLAHPLDVLLTAGFLLKRDDILRQRRPTLSVADPIVRFHDLVVSPRMAAFEDRRAHPAWADAQPALRTQLYGPAFEELAREWTARWASADTLGGLAGEVGTTAVNDGAGRTQHELDVVVLAAGQRRQAAHPQILALGEAKDSDGVRTAGDLHRLEHIRGLLTARGTDASGAQLLLFGRTGFSPDVVAAAAERTDVELIDLERIRYGS
jgi:AAA+ ATPase superfamily predicted ATPase